VRRSLLRRTTLFGFEGAHKGRPLKNWRLSCVHFSEVNSKRHFYTYLGTPDAAIYFSAATSVTIYRQECGMQSHVTINRVLYASAP
jgi:hypothetical protein